MRLVTYLDPNAGQPCVGRVNGSEVVRVILPNYDTEALSMRHIIEAWGRDADEATLETTNERHALADVRLLPPIPDPPGNVICLGRNYAEHAQESARAQGEEVTRPTFFSKAITSIIGPYDDIAFDPELSTQVDWEAELAVIIGRPAKHVDRDEALSYVFGYTVVNDISARDIQSGYGGQFFYGKSLDGSCPIGPWIVTADEVPDPQNLAVRLWVDGVLKQDDSTRNMIFDVAESIAILARGISLLPGQIIATGTPAGVGFARKPPEFLRPGDIVETEIEGIGRLRNAVSQV